MGFLEYWSYRTGSNNWQTGSRTNPNLEVQDSYPHARSLQSLKPQSRQENPFLTYFATLRLE